MTPNEYAEYHKKNLKTINDYLNRGFIQGAVEIDGVWDIPEDARLPYTENRIKPNSDQPSIYKSILTGVVKNRGISHRIYRMTEQDFDGYIEVLLDAGLIVKSSLSQGVYTYKITQKGMAASCASKKEIMSFIGTVAIPTASLAVQAIPQFVELL